MARDVSHGGVINPQRGGFTGEKVAYHPASGVSISRWDVLYVSGVRGTIAVDSAGQPPSPCLVMSKADADAEATSKQTLFMALQDAEEVTERPNDPVGTCSRMCVVGPIDTSSASLQDPVYLSLTGSWTLTAPSATPDVVRIIGYVVKVSATEGAFLFDQTKSGGDGLGYTVT